MSDSLANSIRCDDTSEGAAIGLLGMMTGISEENWCAGWMSGIEFDLWEVVAGKSYGQGVITDRQARLLRDLSDECDGWWYWQDGPKFIRREAWRERVATLALRQGQ